MLIPNVKELEQSLEEFASIIDADEVLLFERATFLVISHCERRAHRDIHRFEKVSNIIKQFKLSCRQVTKLCSYLRRGDRSCEINTANLIACQSTHYVIRIGLERQHKNHSYFFWSKVLVVGLCSKVSPDKYSIYFPHFVSP